MRIRQALSFVTLCFILGFEAKLGWGGTIEYGWRGLLLPSGPSDPWNVGAAGTDFELRIVVRNDAVDILDHNVEFAGFGVESAELRLDGDLVPFVGDGLIDCTDNEAGRIDVFSFTGDFQQLGQTLEIGSAVTLPVSAFELRQLVEAPPSFATQPNLMRASCCGGTYGTVVPSGNIVSVSVPEPNLVSSVAVYIGVMIAFVARRQSRM
ncbi:MAG: hypothetical protein U0805_16825 [Pirellulales bacterium]